MNTDRFRKVVFTLFLCILLSAAAGVSAHNTEAPQIPEGAAVTVTGGGSAPLEDEKIANGGGTDDFGTVYSADGDLNFDLIRKTDLLNDYGSQNALWVNDRQQGGGGNSVAFDADGVPEVTEDTKFVRTDHFLYPSAGETVRPDSLAVWARSVTLELTEAGTPRTRSMALSEDLFPMKLVQFYNVN